MKKLIFQVHNSVFFLSAAVILEDLREKFLKFLSLHGICKSFIAEVTKEYAEFTKFFIEALCFFENSELNDPDMPISPFRFYLLSFRYSELFIIHCSLLIILRFSSSVVSFSAPHPPRAPLPVHADAASPHQPDY